LTPVKITNILIGLEKNLPTDYTSVTMKDMLVDFERRKDSLSFKDINKYSFDSLKKELDNLSPSRKDQKNLGAVEVTNKDLPSDIKIYLLEGPEAAKQYSAGTKWCISNPSTFLEYCESDNLYVVTKGGRKFCLLIRGEDNYDDYNTLYDEKDNEFEVNDTVSFIFKFCGIEADIIGICEKHASKYPNFWRNDNEEFTVNKKYIDRVLSLLSAKDAWDHLLNSDSSYEDKTKEEIIRYFFDLRNDVQYTDVISLIAKEKLTFRPSKGYTKPIKISDYLKDLMDPASIKKREAKFKKENEKAELLNKINEFGGLDKLLNNKKVVDLVSEIVLKPTRSEKKKN
jgi:hypothetical protein